MWIVGGQELAGLRFLVVVRCCGGDSKATGCYKFSDCFGNFGVLQDFTGLWYVRLGSRATFRNQIAARAAMSTGIVLVVFEVSESFS